MRTWILTAAAVMGLALSHSHVLAAEPVGQRYLIIHADDAGMSHSANRGTIDAMENGIVSSASIMVPCAWFPEFADYARRNPDRDWGVHLTVNCEWKFYRWGPVAPREKVPSLIDPDGYLWSNTRQVAEHAKADEVAIELRAQIDRAIQFGVPLTHLDTHMGALATRPDLIEVYVRTGIEYDLPVLFLRTIDPQRAAAYPALARKAEAMVRLLDEKGLPVLDHLVQFYGGEGHSQRRDQYLEALRTLPPGVSQLIVHCGYDDAELQAITTSAARRDSDRRVFTDPEVIAEVERLGIRVIAWKQFRELHAAGKLGAR